MKINEKENFIEKKNQNKIIVHLVRHPKTTLKSVSQPDCKCMAYIEDILSIILNFATEMKEHPKPEKNSDRRTQKPCKN